MKIAVPSPEWAFFVISSVCPREVDALGRSTVEEIISDFAEFDAVTDGHQIELSDAIQVISTATLVIQTSVTLYLEWRRDKREQSKEIIKSRVMNKLPQGIETTRAEMLIELTFLELEESQPPCD